MEPVEKKRILRLIVGPETIIYSAAIGFEQYRLQYAHGITHREGNTER